MPLPAAVHPCIDEAVARATRLVERCVDHAAVALEEEFRRRGNPGARQELDDAVREMQRQRPIWCVRFPQILRQTIDSPAGSARPAAGLHPSSLTLVDDSEVMQSIESSRLAQQLAGLVEQPLKELDALMSSALGLEGISPEQNPLRPEVFTQALRKAIGESEPKPSWPALWMRHMAEPVAQELEALYRAAADLLVQAQVQAAGYRVLTTPGALGPRASQPAPLQRASGPAPLSGFGGLGRADPLTQPMRGRQLTEFLARDTGAGQIAPDPAFYARIDRELAALQAQADEAPPDPDAAHRFEHLPVVDRPPREVRADSPLNTRDWGAFAAARQRSLLRTRLKKQARRTGQVMGLELVRELVDQVAQDPRLLAPVREAIVALEPSLGRLAMQAPRFFGDKDNPARQLVERVAERSFKYNDEFEGQFQQFFAEVRDAFNGLNGVEQFEDAQPFGQVLHQLQASWHAQDHDEAGRQRQLTEALRQAEKRRAEAEQIARELSHRSDLEGVPALVQEFLFGPWALVVAHARLQSQRRELDPGGYLAVVTDLLWSVRREATLRDPARAFTLIPRVLLKLREGLELLGRQPAESETFFQALERLHRPVLKLRAKHRQQSLGPASAEWPTDVDLSPAAAQKPQAMEEMWLAPEELAACGFEDTLPSDFAQLTPADHPAPAGVAAPAAALTQSQAQTLIAALQEGSWVDLHAGRKWRRARLAWTDSKGSLFMFISRGGRPHSMTRRSLERLVAGRLLRPVESHEVVQRAIDTLARPQAQSLAA